MYLYKNITGNTAIELINNYDSVEYQYYDLSSISFCNIHATDAVVVDLYLTKSVGYDYSEQAKNDWTQYDNVVSTYYILNNVTIPNGVTLKLEQDEIQYDDTEYKLYIKLDQSDSAIDAIINTKIISATSKLNQKRKQEKARTTNY